MKQEQVDLENCAREPIHLSGAVQPHGVLLAVDPRTFVIERRSANAAHLLGGPVSLGQRLDEVLDDASMDLVRQRTARLGERRALHPLTLRARHQSAPCDGILHVSGGLLVLELECGHVPDDLQFADVAQELRDSLAQLHGAVHVEDLARIGVAEIRHLTGFDRVMAYRFDADDHGEVIAEAKRDDLETYLGLHYPASDIPAQARRLYTVNWLRSIVDVDYRPVPIEPEAAPPLDLSFSVLRSVSPIHVEYLRNMGIHASMSISIVVDGRLWGMFICHHYAPRFVPYQLRVGAEFLAQTLSWQISARDRADATERRANAETRLRSVVSSLEGSADTLDGIVHAPQVLLDLVDATGVCIVHEGQHTCAGRTLPDAQLAALLEHVAPRIGGQPYATHHLGAEHPPAKAYAHVASGVLAVPLLGDGKSYVLWFRPEEVQTVSWAGKPEKAVVEADGVSRLSPRGSFALWVETVRGQSLRWEPWQLDIANELARVVAVIWGRRAAELERLNRQLQATAEELREANLAKDDFLATVSHELRNPLNSILGWVRLMRGSKLAEDRHQQAMEIIERNAQHQAKLIEDLLDVSRIVSGKLRLELSPVDLVEIVDLAVEGLRPAAVAKELSLQSHLGHERAQLLGDPARLQQVVWNLLNNALKFTPEGGRIDVYVERDGDAIVTKVQDTGNGIRSDLLEKLFDRFRQAETGPGRAHQGLGLGLSIVRHLVELHGGTVVAYSPGEGRGSTFTVRLPLQPAGSAAQGAAEPIACPALVGKTVLVVEDEPDARQLLLAELSRCMAEVVLAASGEEALLLLQELRPHLIISDVGMPGMDGYALMRQIRLLPAAAGGKTPAIALTAYARAEDRTSAFRAGFQAHVPKPVELMELFAVISSLLHE